MALNDSIRQKHMTVNLGELNFKNLEELSFSQSFGATAATTSNTPGNNTADLETPVKWESFVTLPESQSSFSPARITYNVFTQEMPPPPVFTLSTKHSRRNVHRHSSSTDREGERKEGECCKGRRTTGKSTGYVLTKV